MLSVGIVGGKLRLVAEDDSGEADAVKLGSQLVNYYPGYRVYLHADGTRADAPVTPSTEARTLASRELGPWLTLLVLATGFALSQAFLLRIAEFNAEYDYVKLALDKTSLNLRLDSYASLMDVAAFSHLEGQAALAADQAYAFVRNMLPPTSP